MREEEGFYDAHKVHGALKKRNRSAVFVSAVFTHITQISDNPYIKQVSFILQRDIFLKLQP